MSDSAPATADKLPKDLAAEQGMVNVQIDGTWMQVPKGTRMIEASHHCDQGAKALRAMLKAAKAQASSGRA